MSTSFTKYPPHKLTVEDDGTFVVKSGDCLSAYTWAIKGSWGNETDWNQFRRPGASGPVKIENLNLIRTGETLIYLPLYKPGKGGGGGNGGGVNPNPNPGNGNGGGPSQKEYVFPMYQKSTPLKTKGKFVYQFIVTAEGQVEAEGVTVRAGDPETFGNKVAAEIGEGWISAVDSTVTFDDLKGVCTSYFSGTRTEFNTALGELVSYAVRKSYAFPNLNVQVNARGELSETPAVLTASFHRKGSFDFQGYPVNYQGRFSVTVKIGLSKEGWKELLKKANIVLAVGATLSTVALLEWLIGNAHDRGEKGTYARYYGKAYVQTVFDQQLYRLPHQQSYSTALCEMVECAMEDVQNDMRELGIDFPYRPVPAYDQIPTDFWAPAKSALKRYRDIVVAQAGGSESTAQWQLEQQAIAKAERKLGI